MVLWHSQHPMWNFHLLRVSLKRCVHVHACVCVCVCARTCACPDTGAPVRSRATAENSYGRHTAPISRALPKCQASPRFSSCHPPKDALKCRKGRPETSWLLCLSCPVSDPLLRCGEILPLRARGSLSLLTRGCKTTRLLSSSAWQPGHGHAMGSGHQILIRTKWQ